MIQFNSNLASHASDKENNTITAVYTRKLGKLCKIGTLNNEGQVINSKGIDKTTSLRNASKLIIKTKLKNCSEKSFSYVRKTSLVKDKDGNFVSKKSRRRGDLPYLSKTSKKKLQPGSSGHLNRKESKSLNRIHSNAVQSIEVKAKENSNQPFVREDPSAHFYENSTSPSTLPHNGSSQNIQGSTSYELMTAFYEKRQTILKFLIDINQSLDSLDSIQERISAPQLAIDIIDRELKDREELKQKIKNINDNQVNDDIEDIDIDIMNLLGSRTHFEEKLSISLKNVPDTISSMTDDELSITPATVMGT